MLRKKNESVEWLEFEQLAPLAGIRHAVFLRQGGVSQGPFSSLNAGAKEGDAKENIAANRKKMAAILQCPKLYGGHQVHGIGIELVSSEDSAKTCDGMITKESGLGLCINHADCQAALFYDPVAHIAANIHAGWRGQVQNIYGEAVAKLKNLGCRPENIIVGISPSLGPCCAEFIRYQEELPKSFWQFQKKPLHFDLWAIAEKQLLEAGILPNHLEIARTCTKCNSADFFSYRREKMTGRNATVIVLQT